MRKENNPLEEKVDAAPMKKVRTFNITPSGMCSD
jgi:hypothetical protein